MDEEEWRLWQGLQAGGLLGMGTDSDTDTLSKIKKNFFPGTTGHVAG